MFTRVVALLSLALFVVAQAPQCGSKGDTPYCCDKALKPTDPQVQAAYDAANLEDDWNNLVADMSGKWVGEGCLPLNAPASSCPSNPLCCGQNFTATHGTLDLYCTFIPKN